MKRAGTLIAVSVAAALLMTCSAVRANEDGSSFTIRPHYSDKEIYDVYERARTTNQPQFITTDLALHTGHLLFDYSLRAIEIGHLYALADKLTKAMIAEAERRQGASDDLPYGAWFDDLNCVKAFFSVPARILDPSFRIPETVKERVLADLELIEKHEGYRISLALDSAEDFSQYVPRGHYTRNEQFERYFKAMTWYGRRMFRVQETRPESLPIPDHWSDAHMLSETRQLLLITHMLYNVRIDGKAAIETWNRLYLPTVLFAGRTEDLNPMEVKALAENIWSALPSRRLGDKRRLRKFIDSARAFSRPKIDSSGAGRKGFCLFAQRFTPDSYIMQCLVTDADRPFGNHAMMHPLPYSGNREPRPFTWGLNLLLRPPERRFMPRGLDVMAVLGSDEALAILQADGDTEYTGYDGMISFLRDDIRKMMKRRRGENLYYAWVHALLPLMRPIRSEHVPAFLRSRGWGRKQLATSLASWTELRHDTILYVKQSYTPTLRSAMPPEQTPPGYVEPQPDVFRRIAKMVAKMNTDLAALGVMPDGLDLNYRRFSDACRTLANIADKEIAGEKLTEEDFRFIRGVSRTLKATTVLPLALRKKVLSGTDSRMALIADVHTDTNSRKVLEEAVGTPFLLTVKMPIAGEMITLKGAVFSYYEFKRPMKDRLTDEAWVEMLSRRDTCPELPHWYPAAAPK